jgi:hypothetical protein
MHRDGSRNINLGAQILTNTKHKVKKLKMDHTFTSIEVKMDEQCLMTLLKPQKKLQKNRGMDLRVCSGARDIPFQNIMI